MSGLSPAPASPRPAASVVALRDSTEGPEVLLVRRHERSRDFAGASVYPGGLVDAEDAEPELAPAASRLALADARTALGEDLLDEDLRALWVAACRELFEEAGILLARDPDGAPVRPEVVEALGGERVRLQDGSRRLRDLLAETGLVLALDGLVPFARWITPEAQPRRWDTRFFLVAAPASQRELADGTETSLALWSRPADALAAYRTGEHLLAPPTFRILEEVSRRASVAEALDHARAAGPPRAILPFPVAGAAMLTFVYPGDRDHPHAPGAGIDRLLLDGGRWRSERSA